MPPITFLTVSNSQEKLSAIYSTVHSHYEKGERVMVCVQNEETAKFIDLLLWKTPPDSFLPHCTAEEPIEERVVITTKEQNLNKAQVLINLRSHVLSNLTDFAQVYELFDRTTPDKEQLSHKKRQDYEATGNLTKN